MVNWEAQRQEVESNVIIELAIIFCLLVSLGFPGSLTNVLGDSIEKLMEYGAFAAEIVLILLSSGGSWQDIELLHLDKKYTVLYLYVLCCFALSMLVTYDRHDQFITCARFMVTLLFVIWLQERFRLDSILELLCMAQWAFVLVTLLFMARYSHYAFSNAEGQTHALVGLFNTKNACATELDFGIAAVVLLIHGRVSKSRRVPLRWWALLFVQIALLLMCKATSAAITAIFIFIPSLLRRQMRLPLGLLYIVVNIFFLFGMLMFMPLFEDIFVAMGKDATLSGRIPMWRRVIEVMINNKTMTGFGYGMFWRDPSAVLKIQTGFSMRKDPFMATLTTGAHNVVLETWLNTGLLGVAAFFYAMLYSFRDMHSMSEEQYSFCATVMTYLTINGLTERCLGGNYDYKVVACFMAMAVGCKAAGVRRHSGRRRAPVVRGAR